MKVYYIFDAYCCWCYGFDSILVPFIAAHPELEVEVISGGLFTSGKPLAAFTHLADAAKEIVEIYGVKFGQAYQERLKEGTMVPLSNDAAIGFGILREFVPASEQVNLAARVQKAFYMDGKSLSEAATWKEITADMGLSEEEIAEKFECLCAEGEQHTDFAKARAFGVSSYPTLLAEVDGRVFDLRRKVYTLDELEANLELLKSEVKA